MVVGRIYCPTHEREMQKRTGWGRGSTRKSRATREIVLRNHPVCYLRYPGCTIVATEDEHVLPRAQGGSDALSNRKGACHHCHQIKTQREAAQARAGRRSR